MPTRLPDSTTLLFRDGERLAASVIGPLSLRVAEYVRRRYPHINQVGRAYNTTSWRGPDRLSPRCSVDLAARPRTTRRAIATRLQQSDCWILINRRLNIGKETSQTRTLLGRRHSTRKGLSMNLN
jgi:hypothetical protein